MSLAVVEQNEVKSRLAEVLKSVIQEMTSCDQIQVMFSSGEQTTIYQIVVPASVRGKVIGIQGRNISTLRHLIYTMGKNHGFRAIIELVI